MIGNNFGEGNLGARGFARFIQTHQCNSICRYLNLNPIDPIDPHNDSGTAPRQLVHCSDLPNQSRMYTTIFF